MSPESRPAGRSGLRLLVVDDDPDDRALAERVLRREYPELQTVAPRDAADLERALAAGEFDLVLTDYQVSWTTGVEVLRAVKGRYPDRPVIMFTGTGDEMAAVEAMKGGLDDYVLKAPKHAVRLPSAVRAALERSRELQARVVAERRYRELFESVPVGLFRSTPEGRIVDANPAVVEMLGYPDTDSLLGTNAAELYREPADRERIGAELARLGQLRGFEVQLRRLDGTLIWVSEDVTLVRDEAGNRYFEGALREITERKRTEEALRRQNAELAALQDTTLDVVNRLDVEAVLQTIVERASALLDAPAAYVYLVDPATDELVLRIATGPFSATLGARARRGEGVAGRAWSTGEPKTVDDYHAWEGRIRHFDRLEFRAVVGVPLHRAGQVVGVLGLSHTEPGRVFTSGDVAFLERFARLASIALDNAGLYTSLRESEERYRRLAENAPDLIYRFRLAEPRGFEYVNPAAEAITGYTPEEHYADPDLGTKLVHPEDRPLLERAAAGGGEGQAVTLRWVRKDGSVVWTEQRNVSIRDGAGNVVAIEGIARDVTERERTAAALRHNEARLALIFESVADIVFLIALEPDGGYRFETVNRAFLAATGLAPDQVVGRRVEEVLPPSSHALVLGNYATAIQERRRVDWEEVAVYPAGERVGEVTVAPVFDESGRCTHLIGGVHDITERRRLEEQFLQAQKMEAVGRLAGGIAHDFNNLMTAVLGYAQLLREDLGPQDPRRADVEEIETAAERASALTDQLLAFSRRRVLQPRVVDLGELVSGIAPMLRRLIGEDVELRTVLAPDLRRVRADPTQLEQVIVNLAVNARDAMPAGGTLTIETRNAANGPPSRGRRRRGAVQEPQVMLAVSDTGHGMDEETQQHLFEPFFTTKEAGRGTGLGLATVHGIVEQSGGTISVHSEPGIGTTFRIYLPPVEEEVAAVAPVAEPPGPRTGTETVLLVEDEPAVRTLVSTVLRRAGHTVLEAGTGDEALLLAATHRGAIDLLVTDVVMPGMNGRELAARLVASRPVTRVLFASGYSQDVIARHSILEAGVALIEKPFTPAGLLQRVREVLEAPALPAPAPDA